MRLKAEELCREQDQAYVLMLLEDLSGKVIPDALRDGFKTQPPVDRRFSPVPAGFYCSKQWQPPGTGQNRRSTGGWVLKPPLKDMEYLLASTRRRIACKVDQVDYDTAELLFNEDSTAFIERQDEVLAAKGNRRKERQPKKRKATSQQQQRPSKWPRKDSRHSKRHERPVTINLTKAEIACNSSGSDFNK